MQAFPERFSLRAALIFSPHQQPVIDAWINVCDGKITGIGNAEEQSQFELGHCAVLPGLVNAHAHLEFSDLKTPLGQPNMPLADWIGNVLSWRTSREQSTTVERILAGIDESLAAGVVAVADILSEGALPTDAPLHYLALQELIGTNDAQIDTALDSIRRCGRQKRTGTVQHGLSPHAPYSVRQPIWEQAVAESIASHLPLAVHLAETREELDFLATGQGCFHDLLVSRGVHDFARAGKDVLSLLKILAAAPRILIAHGNYLTDEEIEFLAKYNDRFTVVYCPRTHTYFGHDTYPLEPMLEAGIQVAIGTDGRGSNPDLSLWKEMLHIAKKHPDLKPESILQMGTLTGAHGLGLADRIGTLQTGKEASLAVVRLPQETRLAPYARLLHRKSEVVATFLSGQLVAGTVNQAAQ